MGAVKRTPLFRKVLAGVVVVFAVVAGALSIASAWHLDRSLRLEFRSKGTAIARSIASSAVELLLNRDVSTLQATIDQFLEIRGVAYVFVVDENREIVAHTFVPVIPEAIRTSALKGPVATDDAVSTTEVEVPGAGSFIDIAAPILSGVGGTAHVGMDLGVIAGDVRAAIVRMQAILLPIFVLSLVAAYVFVNRTARPLQALTDHVRRFAASGFQGFEPDPRVERLPEQSRDEVGELAEAFLAMGAAIGRYVEDLRRAGEQLAAHNRDLEQRVAERTEQLVEKNRELAGALVRLEQAQQQIITQEKLASLGALTAGIAHEIKNPLNFITNFAQLSNELAAELDEALRAALPPGAGADIAETIEMLRMNVKKIDEHGRRADSIVRNMLRHSHGRGGERAEVDLNALVHEDVGLAYHGVRAQDNEFRAKIDERYDPAVGTVSVVPQDLSRALLNILTNACYALRDKQGREGPGFAPVLTVTTRALDAGVEVRIRDNGDGVPEDIRKRIFEPFFTTRPAGSGTGLGLSMAFDIVVKEHGGDIRLETEPGRFTEFILTLPRTPGEDAATASGHGLRELR